MLPPSSHMEPRIPKVGDPHHPSIDSRIVVHHEAEEGATHVKRNSRACDQCRNAKRKCKKDQPEDSVCSFCLAIGAKCTFATQTFKRGPPKGYLKALEHRWQGVESLLGALLASQDPHTQHIIDQLRSDGLARDIIERVETGPFGPTSRFLVNDKSHEEIFAMITPATRSLSSSDAARARRQSRINREDFSTEKDGSPGSPSAEWQDRLARTLEADKSFIEPGPLGDERYDTAAKECAEALGQLSLDEHNEIRYHGKVSGLHFLNNTAPDDETHRPGGVWRMPMANDESTVFESDPNLDVRLPPFEEQERLVDLYFTYIHPTLPVLHQECFRKSFQARCVLGGRTATESHPLPAQPLCYELHNLLLLSIFSVAAKFIDPHSQPRAAWRYGDDYAEQAHRMVSKIGHQSRTCTCQALLILGLRAFGTGDLERAWIYLGLGIRMAQDLGINRSSATWQFGDKPLFGTFEIQCRNQIWSACLIADEYGSTYIGRPTMIHANDYDAEAPAIDEQEDLAIWKPADNDPVLPVSYIPAPCRMIECFVTSANLSCIIGGIVSKIYPIRDAGPVSRRAAAAQLETSLDRWLIDLPSNLRVELSPHIPPPHIIGLHIKYWSAVLLLHRAFLPHWTSPSREAAEVSEMDLASRRAFDLSQNAACKISSLVAMYQENFDLARCLPFLCSYIMNAGIMHTITLNMKPGDFEASAALKQCLTALEVMSVTWPFANRAHDLLSRAQIKVDRARTSHVSGEAQISNHRKRRAGTAFKDPIVEGTQPMRIEMPPPFLPGNQMWTSYGSSSSMASNMAHFEPSATTSAIPFYTSATPWWQSIDMGPDAPINFSTTPLQNLPNVVLDDLTSDPSGWVNNTATQAEMYQNYFGYYSRMP